MGKELHPDLRAAIDASTLSGLKFVEALKEREDSELEDLFRAYTKEWAAAHLHMVGAIQMQVAIHKAKKRAA